MASEPLTRDPNNVPVAGGVDSSGYTKSLQVDDNKNLKVTQATQTAGEDLANDIQGVGVKPVVGAVYSGVSFFAPLNDVDILVKATSGNLLSIATSNINAAIRYLQIHNKATAPSNGDTPIFSIPVPAGSATVPGVLSLGRDFFGQNGHYLSTGISVGISTTAATFTGATVTDHVANGTFV